MELRHSVFADASGCDVFDPGELEEVPYLLEIALGDRTYGVGGVSVRQNPASSPWVGRAQRCTWPTAFSPFDEK